jgi:hypothetical protein
VDNCLLAYTIRRDDIFVAMTVTKKTEKHPYKYLLLKFIYLLLETEKKFTHHKFFLFYFFARNLVFYLKFFLEKKICSIREGHLFKPQESARSILRSSPRPRARSQEGQSRQLGRPQVRPPPPPEGGPGRRRWGTAPAAAAPARRSTSSAPRSPATSTASPPPSAPARRCSPAARSSTASPRSTSPPRTATSRYYHEATNRAKRHLACFLISLGLAAATHCGHCYSTTLPVSCRRRPTAIPFRPQVVSLALDLCVHPDVVNRHKQVRTPPPPPPLHLFSLSSLLFPPDTSGLQFVADGADARGDAREDGLRSAAARRRRQCEPLATCSCWSWSRNTKMALPFPFCVCRS